MIESTTTGRTPTSGLRIRWIQKVGGTTVQGLRFLSEFASDWQAIAATDSWIMKNVVVDKLSRDEKHDFIQYMDSIDKVENDIAHLIEAHAHAKTGYEQRPDKMVVPVEMEVDLARAKQQQDRMKRVVVMQKMKNPFAGDPKGDPKQSVSSPLGPDPFTTPSTAASGGGGNKPPLTNDDPNSPLTSAHPNPPPLRQNVRTQPVQQVQNQLGIPRQQSGGNGVIGGKLPDFSGDDGLDFGGIGSGALNFIGSGSGAKKKHQGGGTDSTPWNQTGSQPGPSGSTGPIQSNSGPCFQSD